MNVSTKSISVKSLVAGGRDAFTRVVESVGEDENHTPLEYAEAIAQLGDFNLAFGKRKTASEMYQRAHGVLAEGTQSGQLADAYFSEPTAVRFMNEDLRPVIDEPDMTEQVHLDISMTVTRGGRPLDIDFLGPTGNIPGHELRKIKRGVSDMRFRPRLSDGLPEETRDFVWQLPLARLDF